MKITCDSSAFSNAVSVLSRIVPSHSPSPSLMGILMKTEESSLSLFGYDLDLGINTKIDAYVEEKGSIILPAKILFDISRHVLGEKITINANEKNIAEIVSGSAIFNIAGISYEEYPEFPTLSEGKEISLPQNALYSMINQTIFAVAQTDPKPVHTGSLFEIENNEIRVISVDGYRLALRKEKINFNETIRFVVPGKTLSEISKILSEDEDKEVKILVNQKKVLFKIDNYLIFSRLLEGNFLDYKSAIPQNNILKVKVKTREMLDCVDRVSLIISEHAKSPLRIKFKYNEILLSCNTNIGKSNDKISVSTDGEEVEMGFNSKYLIDALRNSDSDEVILEIAGPLSPMKVLPLSGDNFLFLVLPVRLHAE